LPLKGVALLVVATVVTAAVVVPVSEPDHPLKSCLVLCAKLTSLLALNAAELLSFVQKRNMIRTLLPLWLSFCYAVFFVLRYEISV
jgi:hypothetical protein